MPRYTLLLILCFVFSVACFGQGPVAGLYESETGSITLRCNHTFQSIMYHKKDTFQSAGKWSAEKNRLLLQLDSAWVGRDIIRDKLSVLIYKDSLLYPPKPSRADYRATKQFSKKFCIPVHVPSYAEYKKTPVGKLKRTVLFPCK